MRAWLSNVYRLGLKELASVWCDRGMMIFIVWAFTGAIYLISAGAITEMHDAAVGFVDNDKSALSQSIRDSLRPPLFKRPVPLDQALIDTAMDTAQFTFIVVVPPGFERDVLSGRKASREWCRLCPGHRRTGVATSAKRGAIESNSY
jgi:ABC-2 type transport system permease protein